MAPLVKNAEEIVGDCEHRVKSCKRALEIHIEVFNRMAKSEENLRARRWKIMSHT